MISACTWRLYLKSKKRVVVTQCLKDDGKARSRQTQVLGRDLPSSWSGGPPQSPALCGGLPPGSRCCCPTAGSQEPRVSGTL